jgi:phospholipid transport system substrate-binding protein
MSRLLKWLLPILLMAAGAAQAAEDPQQQVQNTADKILEQIKAQRQELKSDPSKLYDFAEQTVLPYFDFEDMSSWVIGKHWRDASDTQKQKFIEQFRALLVRTYSKALIDNADQDITMLPLRDKPESGDVTVRTEVQQASGFPIPLDYKMHTVNGEWKVYDVVIDSVSMVTNFRSSFSKEIRQGSLDQLIDKLARRNQSEAGGAS